MTMLLWFTMNASAIQSSPEASPSAGDTRFLILEAAEAVDAAWEIFHQAAIGGTLASPRIQFQIEEQLHEARILLLNSKKAEKYHDYETVKLITQQLSTLTHQIVTASQERKQ
ncbi:MAG: hypothetical protein GKS05_01665 [Nitrospirales bacterium]|nr:hypothetical protein [Nitrospirales bacterium]